MNFLVHSIGDTLSMLWDETDGASIVVKEMKKKYGVFFASLELLQPPE